MRSFKYEIKCRPKCVKTSKMRSVSKKKTTLISAKQLFKVLSTGTKAYPQPWLPLINDLIEYA